MHGLGDFDTAISYCLSSGSSIFRSGLGLISSEAGQAPSREEQARLFGYLLAEFLRIEDVSARIERTGELLERFGGWFDVRNVSTYFCACPPSNPTPELVLDAVGPDMLACHRF